MSRFQIEKLHEDLDQIILSAQNAVRAMTPAISNSGQVGYLTDKEGNLISNQILFAMSGLEDLISKTKSAKKSLNEWESGLEFLSEECYNETL